jgi:putative ABC transport system permease protein
VAQASVDIYTLDFQRSAANGYVLASGGTLIPIWPSDTPGIVKRSRQVITQIRRLPGVVSVLGVVSGPLERNHDGPRRPDDKPELVLTMGVDGDPTTIRNAFALERGRWIQRPDEVVVGPKLSKDKKIAVGSALRLGDRTFSVVGVGKLRGLGLAVPADSVAYMEHSAYRDRAGIGDVFSVIIVQTQQPDALRAEVEQAGSLQLLSPADLVRKAIEANAPAMGIYWVMIGLTLAIASLFVSNMLARSVAERRLEFATLRAIGVPRRTILFTVGAEAMLISIAASLIGILVSFALGWLLNTYVAEPYGIESLYSVRLSSYLAVFGLALGLGLVSGLLPARQATRVDPVDVLREA